MQDGFAYFGSHDHKVYAVNLSDGQERWQFETEGVVAGKPFVFDGKVIAGSFDKKLYPLILRRGSAQWSLEGDNWFWAGAITDGRTIFAPNMEGKTSTPWIGVATCFGSTTWVRQSFQHQYWSQTAWW
ncbi:MAG: hypothetical protein Ct9H300mP11_24230 [Chloroflexota bacterium]|nr:MAG: hypothetical protein Ct9H300mP11_24230 [Chloroflexota bacterium]